MDAVVAVAVVGDSERSANRSVVPLPPKTDGSYNVLETLARYFTRDSATSALPSPPPPAVALAGRDREAGS